MGEHCAVCGTTTVKEGDKACANESEVARCGWTDEPTRKRARQIAAGTDRKIPDICDEWYCRSRPAVMTAEGDFLCAKHAALMPSE